MGITSQRIPYFYFCGLLIFFWILQLRKEQHKAARLEQAFLHDKAIQLRPISHNEFHDHPHSNGAAAAAMAQQSSSDEARPGSAAAVLRFYAWMIGVLLIVQVAENRLRELLSMAMHQARELMLCHLDQTNLTALSWLFFTVDSYLSHLEELQSKVCAALEGRAAQNLPFNADLERKMLI